MKNFIITFITTSILIMHASSAMADNTTINSLITSYQSHGAKTANAKNGELFWNKTFSGKAPYAERSCKTCHSSNIKNSGKHARTGKILKPLAPSINKASFNKVKKVNKWFKRNCKWTVGRECSAQEKLDILTFIQQQ